MPELPEVETVARLIAPHVVGRSVEGTRVLWQRSLGGASPLEFDAAVRGTTIHGVARRGKYVLLRLRRNGSDAGCIVVHLRMTGRLFAEDRDSSIGSHTRVALALDDGRELRFDDVRKFGRFRFVEDPERALAHLGPEPLGPEFTAAWFVAALRSRKRVLKPLLLDQEFVVGLGNIYVDESLFRAGLHPLRSSHSIRAPQARLLHETIQGVLREAIEREGSSFDTFYRTPEGNPGNYQHQFQVYGRHGKPCRVCDRTIARIVVGQRGTHVCTRCQPVPRTRRKTTSARTIVRRATLEDAAPVGRLHVRSWQHAYRGQMPDAVLDNLDVDRRIAGHRARIETPPHDTHRIWVQRRGDELIGFSVAGPTRDPELDASVVGEVYAIYLAPEHVGHGHGRSLMNYSINRLRMLGYQEATVWVLESNERARRFYEAAGFALDGAPKEIVIGGSPLIEVRYRKALS